MGYSRLCCMLLGMFFRNTELGEGRVDCGRREKEPFPFSSSISLGLTVRPPPPSLNEVSCIVVQSCAKYSGTIPNFKKSLGRLTRHRQHCKWGEGDILYGIISIIVASRVSIWSDSEWYHSKVLIWRHYLPGQVSSDRFKQIQWLAFFTVFRLSFMAVLRSRLLRQFDGTIVAALWAHEASASAANLNKIMYCIQVCFSALLYE